MAKGLNRRELLRRVAGVSAGAVAAGGITAPRSSLAAPHIAKALRASETKITVIGREVAIPTLLASAKEWMKQTGITVQPAVVSGDLDTKILQSAATGIHLADVHLHDSNLGADLYARGYYLEVPAAVKQAVKWDDIIPFYRDRLSGWQGKTYGIPFDGDNLFHSFRRDILADPKIQDQFKAKYGYALDPATGRKTWKEHGQYAEFFTGRDWNKPGEKGFGFSSMWKRGGRLFWGFISRAAAYAKHPNVPDFYFNLESGDPLINTPPFVRALTEWKTEMQKYAPPGAINFQWADGEDQFLAGRVFMVNYWGDTGKDGQDPKNSTVKGKMGFHFTPGSTDVYNPKTKAWETLSQVSYAPFLGFGGRNFAVAKSTKHADACWEFVKFACSPEMTLKISLTPGSGMDPVRDSQFNVDAWVNSSYKWSPEEAKAYLDTIQANLHHPNLVPDLRIPGWTQYQNALETSLSSALAGDLEPQKALDQAASQWKGITGQLGGPAKQMTYYRDLLGA